MKTIIQCLGELQGQLLTLPRAAKMLGRSRQTIYEHVKAGHIPHIRIGHGYLIDPAELAAWLLKRGARFEVR